MKNRLQWVRKLKELEESIHRTYGLMIEDGWDNEAEGVHTAAIQIQVVKDKLAKMAGK